MIKVSIQVNGVEVANNTVPDDGIADLWVKHNSSSFPAGFTVVKIDLTKNEALEAKAAKFVARQKIGNMVIAKMYQIINQNNLDAATFTSFLADVKIANAERMLRNGLLGKAKAIIGTWDTTFFTAPQATDLKTDIDNYIATE